MESNVFNGVFLKKKITFFPITLIILIALGVFSLIKSPESFKETIASFGLIVLIFVCFSAFFLFYNHGAYFTVDLSDRTVKAKYGWFGHLDCRIDDIAFVHPQANVLSLLFKNGKRRIIPFLHNSQAIAYGIRMGAFAVEKEQPQKLKDELTLYRLRYKKLIIVCVAVFSAMTASVFATVLLTGGRSMADFVWLDRFFFCCMVVVEVGITVFTMIYANRESKRMFTAEWIKYRLNGAILASHPLPSNNVRQVFADANNTLRITVCGFPNDESVFFVVEGINEKTEVEVIQTSEVYSRLEDLPEDEFVGYIDVTEEFVGNVID